LGAVHNRVLYFSVRNMNTLVFLNTTFNKLKRVAMVKGPKSKRDYHFINGKTYNNPAYPYQIDSIDMECLRLFRKHV